MNCRLVRGLNFKDVASAVLSVFDDIFIALDGMQIEVRKVLLVEPPAGIAAHAKDVVDHVADADDAHAAELLERAGLKRKQFVGPEDVGTLTFSDCEDVAIETADTRAELRTIDELAQERLRMLVIEGVQRNDLVSLTLERPEPIERRVVGREA